MKHCSKCRVEKPEDQFYKRADRPASLHSWCIACMQELRVARNPEIAKYQKKRRAAMTPEQKEMSKDYQLRYNFDITLEEYEALLEKQDYKCAICEKSHGEDAYSGDRKKGLSVDHDHNTGAVRGLLCNDCNRGIGQLGETSERLRKAAEYLELHEREFADAKQSATTLLDELLKDSNL